MMMISYWINVKSLLVILSVCAMAAAGPIVCRAQKQPDRVCRVAQAVSSQQPSAGSQLPSAAVSNAHITRIRIAAFNIRMFPCNTDCSCLKRHGYDRCRKRKKSRTDFKRLSKEIRKLRPDILAVNEILEPVAFSQFAKSRLGPDWKFVSAPEGGPLKVGFLYNSSRITLMSNHVFTKIYTELVPMRPGTSTCRLRLGTKMRPALACRFLVAGTGLDFYAVNVHLKAGPCSGIRKQQWTILERFVNVLAETDREILILGDFNDFRTWERDLDDFKARKDFTLISDSIPCSFFGRTKAVTLDHMLASRALMNTYYPSAAEAGGPCAHGCGRSRYRKAFSKRVSDHCPIVTELRIPQ